MIDFGSLKAFADTALEAHGSDHGQRLELAAFIYFIVKRFTKPISAAVKELTLAHNTNSVQISEHSKRIDEHSGKLIDHERRIEGLENDADSIKQK